MIESYIAIEGPIGVGKTSLAEIIADKLNTRKVLEDFKDNPFLDNFYDNIEEYAFQTQMFFLLQRYKQQQGIKQLDVHQKGVVTDYMFDKDRLFASFTLNEPEMELYSRVADILEQDIIKPDLVVYLQADTPLLMQYIKKRGRNLEKGVTSDYIDLVNQRYQEFFVNYEDTPLLIINTNNIDFVENPRDLDELLEIIQKPVQGIKYFNPS
tara:strand:+ start:52 stop:681 length:630 start_codon:yes stop_codon:yes gene_type:complete